MQATEQQQAIYDAVENGQSNLLVTARAGTGKTTTAIECAKRAKGKVGFVAFNKHIAETLNDRLGGRGTARTMHSLGMLAVRRASPGAKLDQDKARTKLQKLDPSLFWKPDKESEARKAKSAVAPILDLARLCKMTLISIDPCQIQRIIDNYDLDMLGWEAEDLSPLITDLLNACANDISRVDFDDMIWLPMVHELRVDQFDLLIVDESQDLNAVQRKLALRASANGRLIAIGDPMQSIYGWSGADTEGMQRLKAHLSVADIGMRDLPLTVTWRCPRSHVELAQNLVSDLQAAPDSEEGLVDTVDPEGLLKMLRPGDMVISRANAALVGLGMRLFLSGMPVMVRGREIGTGLVGIIERLNPTSLEDLVESLYDWYQREKATLERKDASPGQFLALEDRFRSLDNLANQCSDLDHLDRCINRLFSNSTPDRQVVLSSIHRAKGLEANRVFILQPEKLPLVWKDQQQWQYQQELNVAYVAVTRAKRELYFVGEIPRIFNSY